MYTIWTPRICEIAIDFDGTIVENQYPEVGKLKKDAKRAIKLLELLGFDLCLWTCRCGDRLEEALSFLKKNDLIFKRVHKWSDFIIDRHKEEIQKFIVPKKIFADIYIDDKNVLVDDIDWKKIINWIFSKRVKLENIQVNSFIYNELKYFDCAKEFNNQEFVLKINF